ncbi:ATP-dependent DNA helicase RecG [Bifidobacterium dolichotidis]|uniref:ATP-dependent DNA helicase RecG n=2 Tax=Bifidobacterium dolichotidis TaxID=2306976 RepID=A0A430FQJ1_9BIFI|nr:ATP-dependent DNA helicase RecG [Bifidobacterium dolichotidis]RSX55109.1 ATP-dependent DNA helicase RecG [Bifidobacterium dolichotidis]
MTAVTLNTPIASLLTNKRRVSALKSLGLISVADALTYYPFRVTNPVPVRALSEARIGEHMACSVQVRYCRVMPMAARRGSRVEVIVEDSAFAAQRKVRPSQCSLVFFSHRKSYVDWMASRLAPGQHIVFAGDPSTFNDRLQFTHPEILTIAPAAAEATETHSRLRYDCDSEAQALARVCRPRPVYHASSRISTEHIHETIVGFLRMLAGLPMVAADPQQQTGVEQPVMTSIYDSSDEARQALRQAIPDIVPEPVLQADDLMHRAQALSLIHDPESVDQFKAAVRTMRFEEAFICQTALLMSRATAQQSTAWACKNTDLEQSFIASLPFELTHGQRQVVDDISADMEQDHPMQRLLQGEVGSGKTVVAVAAMLQAVGSGHQAVLVAPTQVLAEQHAASIAKMVHAMEPSQKSEDNSDELSQELTLETAEQETAEPEAAAQATAATSKAHKKSEHTTIEQMNLGTEAVPVYLLTGGMRLAERRRVLAAAASGDPCIVIATHAAFSKTFQAPNLALAVVDEQHRFGVEQRETLRTKGERDPHLLVMTATPIPRTAAMTWFGDLDISELTELPGGRKPIRTFIVEEQNGSRMASMFALIRQRIDAGERAYIICPRIDADETQPDEPLDMPDEELDNDGEQHAPKPPLHSVEEMIERLQRLPQFKGVAFAQLTGRDDDETKKAVMADFASGRTPVLVATTVVEVGVDVPEASCIVIFDADRYGLSQLHQLRGRVGRGGTNSWAFLISRAEPGTIAEQRLQVIEGTLDGAEIAEQDLELRGAGDVLGDAQSGGKSSLKLLRVVKDAPLIAQAREQGEELLSGDVTLSKWPELAGAVLDFTRGNEAFLQS